MFKFVLWVNSQKVGLKVDTMYVGTDIVPTNYTIIDEIVKF